ncbi:MAG TPA: CoA transferase [Stellaceae bacterium]|nr:CoA transferase [Stellaceae bacterium]
MTGTAHSPTLPLAGLRALEFTQNVMGPSGGLVLADLGADVVKIEPVQGEATRYLGGFASGFFNYFNRNKRSLAIDLKSERGRALVHRLIAKADIVLENYAPGTMERLGCGYETLSAINPRLVYCALKGYLSGPYEKRAALDEVAQFQSGLAYMTGPHGKPLRAGASVVDILGGTFAAVAILAALRERDQTGKGQLVKSALYESAVYLMSTHIAGGAYNRIDHVLPMPERGPAWGVYQIFKTAEGEEIFIAATSDALWQRFCQVFERPDLGADPRLKRNADRVAARDRLVPAVAETLAKFSRAEIERRCESAGIAFAPVATVEDLWRDPHLAAGGMAETRLSNGVVARLPKLPIELGGERPAKRLDPPLLGEHSRAVLAEAGLSGDEIDALVRDKVVA